MGIPKYRQWLQERFPGAFTTAQSLFADHVVRWAPRLSIHSAIIRQASLLPIGWLSLTAAACCSQYLDANSIMHEVGRRANTPAHFLQLLCGKLDQLFSLVRPTQSVSLCVDGPAAWAKVAEQRKRRRQTATKEGQGAASNSRGGGGGHGRGGGHNSRTRLGSWSLRLHCGG